MLTMDEQDCFCCAVDSLGNHECLNRADATFPPRHAREPPTAAALLQPTAISLSHALHGKPSPQTHHKRSCSYGSSSSSRSSSRTRLTQSMANLLYSHKAVQVRRKLRRTHCNTLDPTINSSMFKKKNANVAQYSWPPCNVSLPSSCSWSCPLSTALCRRTIVSSRTHLTSQSYSYTKSVQVFSA